jgi:MoxR-like ATPase
MQTVPLSAVATSATVPLDFRGDYRASAALRDYPLVVPDAATRAAAYERIAERLAVPTSVLDEIITGIATGKHLLLYGPPGTGKTSLARLAAEELFDCEPILETATSDWTPFETAGGPQLTTVNGAESLEPTAGVITQAVVRCLEVMARHEVENQPHQAAWLVIDELNRANMDAALGPYFTALDPEHPTVSLPFFDEHRRSLTVPRRFRLIGTMNSYDKNFLFRMSYALTRRFALVEVGVPDNNDNVARAQEREALWKSVSATLMVSSIAKSPEELRSAYDEGLAEPLYQTLVTQIRDPNGLGRGIGFAQVAAALTHATTSIELGLVGNDAEGMVQALDRGVRVSIIPQLEGLPNQKLRTFITWWEGNSSLRGLTASVHATKDLLSGIDLFVTDVND